jgi:hypothetical protein
LTVTGTSNLVITVLGITEVNIKAGDVIDPNTTIDLGALGKIILNEQVADPRSDGVSFAGITANFLDLELALSAAGSSAMLSIIVDGTYASESAALGGAVPEPSSIVLAGIGTVALLGTVRRKRRTS